MGDASFGVVQDPFSERTRENKGEQGRTRENKREQERTRENKREQERTREGVFSVFSVL
jgi:hypothetical protein